MQGAGHRLQLRQRVFGRSLPEGNTRLYTEDDLQQLEVILSLTRDLGVNLAGVEVVLNMRQRIEQIEREVSEFLEYIRLEFFEGREDEFEAKKRALVRISPAKIIKVEDKSE